MTSRSENENFDIELVSRSTSQRSGGLDSVKEVGLITTEELVSRIPLFSETFDVTKKEENGHLKIEKKWVTSKKKIEIPVQHEELFINGRELDDFDENEVVEIFSRLRNKLSDIFVNEQDKSEASDKPVTPESEIEILNTRHNSSSTRDKNIISEKVVSLNAKSNSNTGDVNKLELWGEEITINKKLVKLGEIIIKKYEIQEKRKIDLELKTEKLTLKFPGNYKEEIT